ncbi:hypothetical protein M8I35_20965 [Micromonospora sp. MSM11]|nr:hypothetical protein [Micromonospora sp. MSM11]MCL7459650.1 hypothetical protein [Micromonospora sp. MSM11]
MPITALPRRRSLAVAACLLLLPALSGCFDQERPMPPPAAVSTFAGTLSPTPTPTPTPTLVAAKSPSTSAVATPAVPQRPPVIRSLVAAPDRVDPFSCIPPDRPERPEVVAQVDAQDLDLDAVVVTLSYGVFGTDYQGEVRMRYDSTRRVFVHRLPPATWPADSKAASGISLSVQAEYPSLRLSWMPPPTRGWIATAGRCAVVENGVGGRTTATAG